VVIVNESFVDKYFPGGNAVGERLQFWGAEREIVGVVGDVSFMGIGAGSEPAVYGPMSQLPFSQFDVIVRGAGDPATVLNAVRGEIRQLDPQLAIFNVQRFEDIMSGSLAPQRLNAVLLGVFAGLALALAAVGIYGVIAYGVSQRTQEIGVRMSLGADRGRVQRMILGEGLRMAGAGIVLGIGGALVASRAAGGLLYGVQPVDPLTWGTVAIFLVVVVATASLVPARRASRVEPVVALRES
jgi:predicted lysophospholipase L1 biosynthesis ABC-type transport system permease subunit